MNPPTGLTLTGYYSRGDWEGYTNVRFTAVDKVNCFYRIEVHQISPAAWIWIEDVPWEGGVYGQGVRWAHADPGGGVKRRIVDQIRITTMDIAGISPPASATINTPATVTPPYHVAASNLSAVCFGELGDLRGQVNLGWNDLSKFVGSGRITLSKFGVTSPYVERIIYDKNFSGTPTDELLGVYLGIPNFIYIYFDLMPPGIYLVGDPPNWDPQNPPTPDPRAPWWVCEGDTLILKVTTNVDDDPNPITTTFNFVYHRIPRFYQLAEAATLNQPFQLQLDHIEDPWLPDVVVPVDYSPLGGFPAGLTVNSSGLITGTPTATGVYRPNILIEVTDPISKAWSYEVIQIVVNVTNPPVIIAPPSGVNLAFGTVYPPQYSLYATNHPTSYALVSGTLPTGLSFNTSTGVISGTLAAVGTFVCQFTATNSAGTSPPFTVTFSIVLFIPPTITSPNTMDVYLEDMSSYQIVTNVPANGFRAYDLPTGMMINGSVLTGIPLATPGTYQSQLQAANRWGWGPLFNLQITVHIHPPVISSPDTAEAMVDEDFHYTIAASYHPTSFGATGLPIGLSLNTATGIISGTPTIEGAYDVTLTAINGGGSGTMVLHLNVNLPPVPVIDTSATHGRAITVQSHTPFVFQPAASHNPTRWSADPVPDGLNLDVTTGRLAGQFLTPGLLGIVFVASNRGGDSDPATFYFLVALSPIESQVANIMGTMIDIWVNLVTTAVTIGSADETAGDKMSVKRGDTVALNVIFHIDGTPADLTITELKFGTKPGYEDDYVVYSDSYRRMAAGTFRLYPDFSKNNNPLDSLLVEDKTELIGEIQWTEQIQGGQQLYGVANTIRRSTPTFTVVVMRDIVHPD